VFALAGASESSPFNTEAHDLVFSSQERDGMKWLKHHANVTPRDEDRPQSSTSASEIQIYTDSITSQMFRAALEDDYYNTEVVLLRSEWNPHFDLERIDDGYVFIRGASVEVPKNEKMPVSHLSPENVTAIRTGGNVVYSNGEVAIVETDNRTFG
jgi:hypothetical protein